MQGRNRILIIDDDAMFRNLIMTHLRKDYVVSVATDGKDGYHKAKSHRPDLAIIDIQMPGWDGIKTLQAFRENPSLKDVKIIMLTADATRDTVMSAIRSGAHEYLIKNSFKKDDLFLKVQRLLNSNQLSAQPSVVNQNEIVPKFTPNQHDISAIQQLDSPAKESNIQDVDEKILVEAMDNWE